MMRICNNCLKSASSADADEENKNTDVDNNFSDSSQPIYCGQYHYH